MNNSDRKKLQIGLYIGLAIALIQCLFSMPYDFYQFVRSAAMAIFADLAYLVSIERKYYFRHSQLPFRSLPRRLR